MMARTHIAFAALMMVACSVGILQRMPQVHEVALAGAAGLLPDLDHPKSTFGRIVPYNPNVKFVPPPPLWARILFP